MIMTFTWHSLDEAGQHDIKYVVLLAQYEDQFILIRHTKRSQWELPGGKREAGEDPIQAASRELYEETGALAFELTPFAINHMNGSSGMTFHAKVTELGHLPDYEIAERKLAAHLPDNLLYGSLYYESYERWLGSDQRKLTTYTCTPNG